MRITDTHVYFWGGVFSNFYPIFFGKFFGDKKLPNGDLKFNTSEHYFMYMKAKHFGDKEIMEEIMKVEQPNEAKKLGREVKNYDDNEWDKVRYGYMLDALRYKAKYEIAFVEALMLSDDKILVEASPYDKIWGVGLGVEDDRVLDEKNWEGENLLGKALMELRNELKNSYE